MKNSFVVNYAVNLWLTAMGVPPFLSGIIGFFARRFLGDMLDRGLILIDIQIDRLREALKDPQWRAAAEKAYNLAQARVYTEEEKDAIRKQYQKALADYATYRNGLPDNQNT